MSAGHAPETLRILRVIARLNMGGPARHVILLDRGLGARGHRTRLIHGSLDAGEASLEHLAAEGQVPRLKIPELGRRISILSDVRALLRLIGVIFRESPDVVHTHTAKAGTLGRIAALVFNATRPRRRRSVVVHTFHGHVLHGYFHPAADRLVRLAERSLARITDCIVTISATQRDEISRRFRIAPRSRTITIPLGLHLDALLALPADAPDLRGELGLTREAMVIGYVGRMVPIKDLATLVRAFVLAAARHPTVTLMLVGDGPLRSDLERRVAAAGLTPRVRFVGWTEDLPRVYATMDLCALSSLNEGTPVALIEAMAAGRAVVATRVGGVADVVASQATGLLVPPADPEALAGALLQLAGNPHERRRMGMAGRSQVTERYAPERLVDDIERLYLSLLASKRGSATREARAPAAHETIVRS